MYIRCSFPEPLQWIAEDIAFTALFNPNTNVTKITTIIKIFSNKGFGFSLLTIFRLLITRNKKILMKGSKNPFKACAKMIAGIGFILPIEKAIPAD